MRSTTSENTISKLSSLFACFGVPEILVTDNGTQFTSSTFKRFCSENGIRHLQSPPYHPQSNGQAERFVDTIKRALLKGGREGNPEQVVRRFLMTYRVTPNPVVPEGKSPAVCMFGRKIRTIFDKILPPKKTTKPEQEYQTSDRSLKVGEKVMVKWYQSDQKWKPGVIERRIGKVLYLIRTRDGKCVRHINQIRKDHRTATDTRLPLHLLVDITQESPEECHNQRLRKRKSGNAQPTRVLSRKRRATEMFQVDPKRKSYTTNFKGGRCKDGPSVDSRKP
ncbi:unnamed protein product [Schistosoma rodhaini]|nr:unnamed protein product [Schistosoma rodhaini]